MHNTIIGKIFVVYMNKRGVLEMLDMLKEKVLTLIALVQELKAKNDLLLQEKNSLQHLYDQLVISNKSLTYEYEEFKIDYILLQESVSKDNSQLQELTKERSEAKYAVDELIESIDKLVEQEAC